MCLRGEASEAVAVVNGAVSVPDVERVRMLDCLVEPFSGPYQCFVEGFPRA